ncbi:MAG: DUF1858 domain-containing protein [Bacteroidales bacterium]|nr:DUF1858 domain-containing protein [Bacteroidales bacterium]
MEDLKHYITPKTKVYDLLQNYPELEETLIRWAPEFKKLKNPILRKTITKITSLSHAATIAGIDVEQLVNALRIKVGQDKVEGISDAQNQYNTTLPAWFAEDSVTDRLDIREMLHQGEQPVHEVLSRLKKLDKDSILEITAPFIPAPLIDKATGLGFEHWVFAKGSEEFVVYFRSTVT